MTAHAKKRGRPPGTGIDDMPVLRNMAELMVTEPGLKPTTAYRRLTRSRSPSEWRRIQIKWKSVGARLMSEATAPRPRPSVASTELALMRAAQQAARTTASVRSVGGLNDLIFGAAPQAKQMSETVQATIEAARMAREIYDGPSARLAREIYDSPTARLAREMYNSPEMRLMREIRNALPGWLK